MANIDVAALAKLVSDQAGQISDLTAKVATVASNQAAATADLQSVANILATAQANGIALQKLADGLKLLIPAQ